MRMRYHSEKVALSSHALCQEIQPGYVDQRGAPPDPETCMHLASLVAACVCLRSAAMHTGTLQPAL